MQNVVGRTLVAIATKFGLGKEIQSPTGLYFNLCALLVWTCYTTNSVEAVKRGIVYKMDDFILYFVISTGT